MVTKKQCWSFQLSFVFIIPLEICEVSVPNAIVTAIQHTYGANWPWGKWVVCAEVEQYKTKDDIIIISLAPLMQEIK